MSNGGVRALTICHRYFREIGHRRKLASFLVALPVLLMTLFGVALYDQTVPRGLSSGDVATLLGELRRNDALRTVLTILHDPKDGWANLSEKLLVAAVRLPTDPNQNAYLFVVPGTTTSVVLLDSDRYYHLTLDDQFRPVAVASGDPANLTEVPRMGLPTLDLVPLYTYDNARRVVGMAQRVLGIAIEFIDGPDVRMLDLFFPDIVGLEIMWAGVLGAAVMVTEDRASGARRRILMAPIPRSSFLLGTALANFALIALQLGVLFAMAILIFHVKVLGNPVDLVALVGLGSFSMVGLGLIISYFSSSADEAFYLSTLVNLPMTFLSSTTIPISHGPVTQAVANAFPMTHINPALRDMMVNGAPLGALGSSLVVIVAMGAILYGAGMFVMNRER